MARTKKAATKTTVKTASVSETPAKSVVTTSEENAVKAETPKTDDAKVSVETKAAEKTAEVKPAAAKPVETKPAETKTVEEKPVAAEVEEPAKKPAAKKTVRKTTTAKKTTKTAAKTTTRKTTAKKTETVTEVYVQYWGKEIHTSEVADRIRKIWTDDMGKKASDLKDLKIYIKPEDNGAHYVINGDVTGFIGL